MKYESERNYVALDEQSDRASQWWTGAQYMTGLADDGMGDANTLVTAPGATQSWADSIKSALPVLASVYQQRQLVKMNLERIRRNQEPLTAAEFASQYQPPSAQVQIGATSDTKQILMIAGLALVALVSLRAAKVI